jgi:hypothetical protein
MRLNETAWEGAFSMGIRSQRRLLPGLMPSLISPILAIPDFTSLARSPIRSVRKASDGYSNICTIGNSGLDRTVNVNDFI